jgi:hypothetical protein
VPAPAVIPAPIAYIKVVAVKKLVVEIGRGWPVRLAACTGLGRAFLLGRPRALRCALGMAQDFYFEKIRVFKAGIRSDTLAWNNGIGRRSYFVGF